jgi:membrane protease YdiL (CAAX protease family)
MLLVEIAAAGIAAPVAEELYFRGYLLPRISRLGVWAPLLGTVLFALYHFHSPWLALNRIVAVLPLTYVAYWKKNVIPGAIAHCLLNVLSTLVVFVPLLMKP